MIRERWFGIRFTTKIMFESFRQWGSDYGVYFMNFILKEKSCISLHKTKCSF